MSDELTRKKFPEKLFDESDEDIKRNKEKIMDDVTLRTIRCWSFDSHEKSCDKDENMTKNGKKISNL